MPLSFLEVKKPNNPGGIRAEFERNEKRQSEPYNTRYFNMFQVLAFSNNMNMKKLIMLIISVQAHFIQHLTEINLYIPS